MRDFRVKIHLFQKQAKKNAGQTIDFLAFLFYLFAPALSINFFVDIYFVWFGSE